MIQWLGALALVAYGAQNVLAFQGFFFVFTAVCLLLALKDRNPKIAILCLCLLTVRFLEDHTVLGALWPAPIVLSSTLGLIALTIFQKKTWPLNLRLEACWAGAAILLGLLSIATVGAWLWWFSVTPEQILFKIDPTLPGPIVIALIAAFAVLNGFAEEFLFRGSLLDPAGARSPQAINFTQALGFGLYHFQGFPFGISGSILAFAFALLQGLLRLRSRSFGPIWLAHIVANLGMGAMLYRLTTG